MLLGYTQCSALHVYWHVVHWTWAPLNNFCCCCYFDMFPKQCQNFCSAHDSHSVFIQILRFDTVEKILKATNNGQKENMEQFFPYQKHMGSWSLRQYDFNCQLFFCAVLTLNDYFFHVDKLTALMASRLSGWQCQWNFTQWILNWPMHFYRYCFKTHTMQQMLEAIKRFVDLLIHLII